ncbi:type VI immunity family protein [Phyllobacterium sp. SB3]|uniref:type VI immunity family protein n=1 Tax=Phyllobacterium sp. SB3 TaxID=3156073 RepID=UPI0032AF8669
MTEEIQLTAKSLDWSFLDKIGVASARGTPMLRFGHYIDFIVQDATSVEKRHRMAEVLFEYKKVFAEKVTHYIPHDARRLRSLKKIDYDNYVLERVRTPDNLKKDEGFEASLFGYPDGGDVDDPTLYYAEAIGHTENRKFSSIGIYLPASWPEQVGYDQYSFLIRSWCEKLKPAYGTAGLSILFNEGRQGLDDRLLAFPFAKRFPGLDIPEHSRWSVRMNRLRKRAIRTVNWLTFIDDGFVDELGGGFKLAEELGDLCPIYPYDGGIVIQAGDRPELGDVNLGQVPATYRTVARSLKPIRFDEHQHPLIDAPKPLDALEETLKWVSRFD